MATLALIFPWPVYAIAITYFYPFDLSTQLASHFDLSYSTNLPVDLCGVSTQMGLSASCTVSINKGYDLPLAHLNAVSNVLNT